MTSNCPVCGSGRSPDAAMGLCSHCLLQSILEPGSSSDSTGIDLSRPADARDRILGDYEILGVIARGGMGVVYRARQISLNRTVALKTIRSGEFASEIERKRFRAEAEAAAHLEHPNIVPIVEIGEQDGQDFFVMKLIEGENLAQKSLALSRPLSGANPPSSGIRHRLSQLSDQEELESDVRLLVKIARAVHYAHQRGVLHRDLKPANILLDEHGEPYVTDFGLAKRLESSLDLTLSGAVIGSPNYMSPEQAGGRTREITTATDTFSLGAILFELVAGHPPFQAETPLATMRRVMEEEPMPLRRRKRRRIHPQHSRNHESQGIEASNRAPSSHDMAVIDRDLETICLKCLRKDPLQRYPSAEALAVDLERWLRHEPIEARASTLGERAIKWARRHPAGAGLVAMTTAALIGFVVLILVYGERLRGERTFAQQQEQKAIAAATRAEASENAARERAYAADVYASSQALIAGDLAQARRLLDPYRPGRGTTRGSRGTNSVDPRGFEWRALWEGTRSQEAFAFANLARPARCLVFAPDGHTLVSGGNDGIHLWDLQEHRPLGLFPGPDPGPTDGDHSPTVEQLRPLLDASPALVEYLKTRPSILDYMDANGQTNRLRFVGSLGFTPDGKHLVVGSQSHTAGDYVRSWTFASRQFDFAVPERVAMVSMPSLGDLFAVANRQELDPDNDNLSAHPQSTLVYSFARRGLVAELPGYGWFASISPDGQWVAAASVTRGCVLWHPATGEIVPIYEEYRAQPILSFSKDGRLLFVGNDVRRLVWDVSLRRVIADLGGDAEEAQAIAWSPDGRLLATGGYLRAVKIWPVSIATNLLLNGPGFLSPQAILRGHEADITALAFSPDGRTLASASNDRSIRTWAIPEPTRLEPTLSAGLELDPLNPEALDPASGVVVGRVLGELTIVGTWDGASPKTVTGTKDEAFAGFLAEGQGFVTVERSTHGVPLSFVTRGIRDGEVKHRQQGFPAPKEFQSDVALKLFRQRASPDGKWLAIAQQAAENASRLHLYDLVTGRFVMRFPGELESVTTRLHFSPDSRWLVRLRSQDATNMIYIHDTQTWGEPREIQFTSGGGDVAFAAIDPSSQRIATGGPGPNSLRVWDLASGRLIGRCSTPVYVWHPVWSPDSRRLVVRDGEHVRFWNMNSFQELAAVKGVTDALNAPLGFLPDGQTIISHRGWPVRWTPPTLSEIDREP